MPVKDSVAHVSPAAHQTPHAQQKPAMTSKKTFIEDEVDVDAPRGSNRISKPAYNVKNQGDAEMRAPTNNVNTAESKPATSTAFDPIAAWGRAASFAFASFSAQRKSNVTSQMDKMKKSDASSGKDKDDDAVSEAGSENSITSEDLKSIGQEMARQMMGGDIEAGFDRLVTTIMSGPGHDEEQRKALDTMLPPFIPQLAEQRTDLAAVQEVLNLVIGHKDTFRSGQPKVMVEAKVLEGHKAKMERIVTQFEVLKERAEGCGLELKVSKRSEFIADMAQTASYGCERLLTVLREQGGTVEGGGGLKRSRGSG